MKVLGQKIKDTRKSKKISQFELAQGVCTQATISNIEIKNNCDSLEIFSAICMRLGLEVEDCIVQSGEYKLEIFLASIDELISRVQHKKAYQKISEFQVEGVAKNSPAWGRYHYYLGISSLIGKKDFNESLYHFHRVEDFVTEKDIYYVLTQNGLGVLYALQNEDNRAKGYYERSIKLLDSYVENNSSYPSDVYKIYYNVAKFYNAIGQHRKSMDTALKGIQLNKENRASYYLDLQYYELASSKLMLNKDAALEFRLAYDLAYIYDNEEVKHYVTDDNKRYKLELDFLQ